MWKNFIWRRKWQPTPVLLPGKSQGWRSLVGCIPWGLEKSDMTERLHFTFHFHALEKKMATHSSVRAWRTPGMGEPSGLPSMGSHRVRHDWSDLAAAAKKQSLPIQRQMMRNTLSNVVRESEIAQSCPTLCDPMDCSLLCSSVCGILQERILEWVAISFSRRSTLVNSKNRKHFKHHFWSQCGKIWCQLQAKNH